MDVSLTATDALATNECAVCAPEVLEEEVASLIDDLRVAAAHLRVNLCAFGIVEESEGVFE